MSRWFVEKEQQIRNTHTHREIVLQLLEQWFFCMSLTNLFSPLLLHLPNKQLSLQHACSRLGFHFLPIPSTYPEYVPPAQGAPPPNLLDLLSPLLPQLEVLPQAGPAPVATLAPSLPPNLVIYHPSSSNPTLRASFPARFYLAVTPQCKMFGDTLY